MADPDSGRKFRVLVIDSGVGGLTVLAAIRDRLPETGVIYLADNAGFPYGERPQATLARRLVRLVTRLRQHESFDAVIVACNTASTIALDAMRATIDIPVVGVVPAIKPAGAFSRSRIIGLLATPTTVDTAYVDDLIDRFATDCTVIRVGPPDLAQLAEVHSRGGAIDPERLRGVLAPLFGPAAPPVDTVVLGCTHYPLLLDLLRPLAPPDVRWLEPGPAVAQRLADVLATRTPVPGQQADIAIFTRGTADLADLDPVLRRHGLWQRRVWADLVIA